MKKLCIPLAEEIVYLSLMAYAVTRVSERLEGVWLPAVFLVPALAIAAVNLLQGILRNVAKSKFESRFDGKGRWLYSVIEFGTVIIVFYAFCVALEYFGRMAASFRTLALLSLLSTAAHMMVSTLPGVISEMTEIKQMDEYDEDGI